MSIMEKNEEVIIRVLIEKIKSLESDVWWRDDQIKSLKAQLEAKGEQK